MLYFAYGSNMSARRLRDRVGRVKCLGHVVSANKRLVFTSKGDAPAYASFIKAKGHLLHGRLFELHPIQFDILDIYEGNPTHYHRSRIALTNDDGRATIATTYKRNPQVRIGVPQGTYEEHLLKGYVGAAMHGADINELLEAHKEAIRFAVSNEGRMAG